MPPDLRDYCQVTCARHKIIGYSDLAKLAVAVERDLAANRPNTNTPPAAERAGTLVSA